MANPVPVSPPVVTGAPAAFQRLDLPSVLRRLLLAAFFVVVGALVYLVFSPFRPMLAPAQDYLGRIALGMALLAGVLLTGRIPRLATYRPILLGLLIMLIAVSLDYLSAKYLSGSVGLRGTLPPGMAYLKLNECFVICSVVIGLTLLTGGSLDSIYLRGGNIRVGLGAGLLLFVLAAAGSPWLARNLFMASDLTPQRVLPWIPWLLLFVLANAMEEELLFRGLFLRKLEPFFGPFLANFLVMLVFTFLHNGVSYTSDNFRFLIGVVALALGCGALAQKTGSLWASVLFHAGMDIPILLGIFSNL